VLLRLAYLTVTNTFAVLRLLPMSDRDKDTEILVLRHQFAVLERRLGEKKVRLTAPDRAFLAALLHRLRPEMLRRMRLLVRPDTVLRWHRDLVRRPHAVRSRPKRPGRPPAVRSIRVLVRENPKVSASPATVITRTFRRFQNGCSAADVTGRCTRGRGLR
jgi:putative transposase